MKPITRFIQKILIFVILCSAITNPLTVHAVENLEMVTPGVYQMTDGSNLTGVYARGIDVSRWQGQIDWAKVAANDVKFAMIATRNRSTGTADQYFHANMRGASENGIALGAYIYSYARNPQEAKEEAEFVLNLIKDYPITYPIAFDVEDEVEQGKMTKAQLSAIIDAFCDTIKAAGYYPIVYANEHWLNNKLDASVARKYPIWVARYAPKFTFPNPVIWQASSTGKINGIRGNVDVNFQFKSFAGTTPANTWRTILGERYYYVNYRKQQNTWAKDGNQWYYLADSGATHKGWLNQDGKEYYLNPSNGVMVTGWAKFDNAWSFFDNNGVLKRGWVQAGGKWYLLDKNGYMLTGWVQTGGKKYFLAGDGSMATGWKKQGDAWLYLNADGQLASNWILDGNAWYYLDRYGNMLTGSIASQNRLYYMNADGSMATGWVKQGDAWYYYSPSGAMMSGWVQSNGEWYFMGADGKMVTGVQSIDRVVYYFEPSGKMAHSTTASLQGQDYAINADGAVLGLAYSGADRSGISKDIDAAHASISYRTDLGRDFVSAFNLDAQVMLAARQTTAESGHIAPMSTRAQGLGDSGTMMNPNNGVSGLYTNGTSTGGSSSGSSSTSTTSGGLHSDAASSNVSAQTDDAAHGPGVRLNTSNASDGAINRRSSVGPGGTQ